MTVEEMIEAVIEREGGYVNHPDDKGGPTKYGITLQTYRDATGDQSLAAKAVEKMLKQEAVNIYHQNYFDDPGFGQLLDIKLAEQLFDWGVNAGPRRAVKALQSSLGVSVDGALGPKTALAANVACEGARGRALRMAVMAARLNFYARLVKRNPSQSVFIEGWINRALEFVE